MEGKQNLMIDTILTDLDGTLIPMYQKPFVELYFKLLGKKFSDNGADAEKVISAVWAGTKDMMKNNGKKTNHDRFWDKFSEAMSDVIPNLEAFTDAFYSNEFDEVKSVVKPTDISRKIIRTLNEKGYKTVLATNPVFPAVAVKTRLNWIGLRLEDFTYITEYTNSSYCKPNPEYFNEILTNIGKTPEQCMMSGNNIIEDMAAEQIGIKTYLVTDFIENEKDLDYSLYTQGTLDDFYKFVLDLPAVN